MTNQPIHQSTKNQVRTASVLAPMLKLQRKHADISLKGAKRDGLIYHLTFTIQHFAQQGPGTSPND